MPPVGGDTHTTDPLAPLVKQLIHERRQQGSVQADVAKALGITEVSVSGWESRYSDPTAEHLSAWADAFGYTMCLIDSAGRLDSLRLVPRADETPERHWLRCTIATLRAIREEADKTQAEIAAQLGVSTWTMNQWENLGRAPGTGKLIAWCAELGCHLELRRT